MEFRGRKKKKIRKTKNSPVLSEVSLCGRKCSSELGFKHGLYFNAWLHPGADCSTTRQAPALLSWDNQGTPSYVLLPAAGIKGPFSARITFLLTGREMEAGR